MNARTIDESIAVLQEGLVGFPFDFAFLGGSVLALLVTDPTADTIRVTKDIDVVLDVKTRKQFHDCEKLLVKSGFRHDMREDAPICRWIYKDLTVDVLPVREDVLGWKSAWFEPALSEATEVTRNGRTLKIISAPYFVALKLEAFEERGCRDFITSTDFEDVVCLFNGRENLVSEIATCETLRHVLAGKFADYLQNQELFDAVDGFVQTENNPEARKARIIEAFRAVASLR